MRAIKDAVDRVKISIILPKLIDNQPLLKEKLKKTQYKQAISLVDNFYRRRDFILREQREPLLDHGMIQIIDFFQMNKEMYILFKRVMNKMSHKERDLLFAFEALEALAQRRVSRDSHTQFHEERKLQAMYTKFTDIQEHMAAFQKHIKNRQIRIQWLRGANQEFSLQCKREINEKTELFERAFLLEQ